jgi:hypothetical protein
MRARTVRLGWRRGLAAALEGMRVWSSVGSLQVIVRAPCAALDQITRKNTSDQLSGSLIFVRYYQLFTRPSEPPDRTL